MWWQPTGPCHWRCATVTVEKLLDGMNSPALRGVRFQAFVCLVPWPGPEALLHMPATPRLPPSLWFPPITLTLVTSGCGLALHEGSVHLTAGLAPPAPG